MRRAKLLIEAACFLGVAAFANGQAAPTVSQTANHSSCVNLVALSGAKIDCSHLTPEQEQALRDIPAILKTALENKSYLETILKKLDEMSRVKGIGPDLMAQMVEALKGSKDKRQVVIEADQVSGASPFPEDFNTAIKSSGWAKPDAKVMLVMQVGCCGSFRGAMIAGYAEGAISCNEVDPSYNSSPMCFIMKALKDAGVPVEVQLSPNAGKDVVLVRFVNGFPN